MALVHSKHVSGLILLGAGARLRVHPEILTGISDPANFHNMVGLVIEWAFAPQAPARLVDLARQRMAQIQPSILQGDFTACNDFDIINQLGDIECPVLVLCGKEDRMTPTRYAQFLADQIRGAALEIIPGCGHMIMLEKPDEVKRIMLRFLSQISDQESSQKNQSD
jgi:pimeloyl-ACP methyl ester carboxylesterase